jgi:hypothetical protein
MAPWPSDDRTPWWVDLLAVVALAGALATALRWALG